MDQDLEFFTLVNMQTNIAVIISLKKNLIKN